MGSERSLRRRGVSRSVRNCPWAMETGAAAIHHQGGRAPDELLNHRRQQGIRDETSKLRHVVASSWGGGEPDGATWAQLAIAIVLLSGRNSIGAVYNLETHLPNALRIQMQLGS